MSLVFRRINGRIVPIKLSKQRKKDLKTGTALVGAGLAVGAGTGVGVAKVVQVHKKVFKASNVAYKAAADSMRGQLNLFSTPHAKETMAKAVTKRFIASKMFRARGKMLAAGITLSSIILGEGITRIHKGITGEKDQSVSSSIGERAAASVTTALVLGAYYKALPVKGLGKIAQNISAWRKGMPRPHMAEWFKK
jgi:hypothetical protein